MILLCTEFPAGQRSLIGLPGAGHYGETGLLREQARSRRGHGEQINATIVVDIRRRDECLTINVTNSGLGLHPASSNGCQHRGVGLTNVRDRLRLHYGSNQYFNIEEQEHGNVRVTLRLPLQFSEISTGKLTGYGV